MAGRKSKWRKQRPRKARKLTVREQNITNAIRDWGSLSGGLSVQEKLKLARELRGSGILPKGLRHLLSPPSNDDWGRLTKKATLAIIARDGTNRSDRVQILIKLPYNFRAWLKGFPTPGRIIDCDVLTITGMFNACGVLDYLWTMGYSRYSSKQLRKHIHVFNKWLSEFENQFSILNTYGVDSDIIAAYATAIDGFENEGDENV